MLRHFSLLLALLVIQSSEYPPESQPIPAPEMILRALGWPIPEDEPIEHVEGDVVTVDILVVRAANVNIDCGWGISRINTTASNSGVATVQTRLVGCLQTTYVSSNDASTDLNRLASNGDGFLDEVHPERDRIGADTVVLIGKSCNSCGIAYLMAGPTSAFAYVCDNCMSNSSFEHEWGHNCGMHHDLPNAGSCPNGYGCGWCFGNGFKDVLTYPSPCGGNRKAYYSNPDILDNGTPTGTATANNARILRERAPVLANFRIGMNSTTNHLR